MELMRWTRLFPVWLQCARRVAVSWATIHHKEASPRVQQMSVREIDSATVVCHIVGMHDYSYAQLKPYI
jgi:hypothetical protein